MGSVRANAGINTERIGIAVAVNEAQNARKEEDRAGKLGRIQQKD